VEHAPGRRIASFAFKRHHGLRPSDESPPTHLHFQHWCHMPASPWLLPIALLLSPIAIIAQSVPPTVVTTDVANFWDAFDLITSTTDTALQRTFLATQFLDKATVGQRAMIAARRYTADQYLNAIRRYPRFWSSMRANMQQASSHAAAIDRGVEQLRQLYPSLRPATVTFTVGVFRSPGTIVDGQVLLGSEFALGDSTIDTSEFPPSMSHMAPYFAANPIKSIVQLTVHEYVHTQQRDEAYVLLNRSLYEGVAEYVSVVATGIPTSSPAIAYERTHRSRIQQRFSLQLLSGAAVDQWLYNDTRNEFGIRDLGYAVGYAIAERIVMKARDRQAAIRQLIELAPNDSLALDQIVDSSGYFTQPVRTLRAQYSASRPRVVGISEFRNGDQKVPASIRTLTVHFSAPMDTIGRGFAYGPLGESAVLRAQSFLGFSADRRSASFGISLEPGRRYQVTVRDRFRTPDGIELIPYLIDIRTADCCKR
jgi:hypothetical protein